MSDRDPSLRLFVAVELSPDWLAALHGLQDVLKRGFGSGSLAPALRWVRPEGVHITLKFLGATPESRLEAVQAALSAAVPAALSARLTIGRPGMFPERGSPRVLWAGVGGGVPALAAAAARIDAEMAQLGYAKESRPFAPHLTLARVAEGGPRLPRERYEAVLASVHLPEVPDLAVSSVSLMRSHLGPGGARYERLSTYPPG